MESQKVADGISANSIGALSGRIWHYLDKNGKTSLIKLKSELLSPASLTHLSVGWLLREGKIELSFEHGRLFVSLK